MLFRTSCLLAILSLLSTSDAFTIRRSMSVNRAAAAAAPAASAAAPCASATCLNMSEEETAAEDPAAQSDEGSSTSEDAEPAAAAADQNDILNSPAFLKRKLEVLGSDIAAAEEELVAATERKEVAKEEWGPQLDALQREYTNIQQRMTEQNQEGDSDAKVRVVKGIVDLLDNFDRASGVIVSETEAEKAIESEYKAAYQDILDQFNKLGVNEVETVGLEFDYELHQAVMQMPGTDYEEGVVCQEFQKGFIMGEALIRPAMVAVAL